VNSSRSGDILEFATGYSSESALVEDLLADLRRTTSPWGRLRTSTEFDFQRGRTDVVALASLGILAFEAKLTKWRNALHQAYRNRCFASRSFVVLPPPVAKRAVRFEGEFKRRGVGLCSLGEATNWRIEILVEALEAEPWQQWLASVAEARIRERTGEASGKPR